MRTGRRRIGQHSAALQSLRSNQSSPASLFDPEFRRALPQQRRAYRRVTREDKLTANYPAFIQLASHQSGCGCMLMSARAKAGTIFATISRLAQACKKNRRAESTSGLARAMFYGYESKYVACKSKLILLLASTIVSLSAAAPASAATFALPSAASETSAAATPILLARDVAEPLPGALERHKARTALIPPMKVDNCRCDDPLGTLEPATLHVVEFLAAFFGICGLVLYQLVKLHDKYKDGRSS
ncbi:hypothetical protein GGD63_003453 [Bradyrhizobium sp. cir1]|nr:hypothetical protein [Bradyrhizobium sp. cir1]